jgi:6-phosphogluconate dehydrogenase
MSIKSDIGIIGLGTMGKNLALNLAWKGVNVSVFDKDYSVTEKFLSMNPQEQNIHGFKDINDFVNSHKSPRIIVLLVTAGSPVDEVINLLEPILNKGDIIIDSGNSHYKDTERRYRYLSELGIRFLGMGISGGSEGALRGPSLMPGGDHSAYIEVEKILQLIAAKSKYGPCVEYMGEYSAGHFVKMVHNGIEYGIIGVISEIYQIMAETLLMEPIEIAEVFEDWNNSLFDSFLLRTAAAVLREKEETNNTPYIDLILDVAEQKGTGLWFTQTALEFGIPAPTIASSVISRMISTFKELREKISRQNRGRKSNAIRSKDKKISLNSLMHTFLFVNFIAFNEGLWLLKKASSKLNYNTELRKVLKVWRNGSILESNLIDDLIALNFEDKNCLLEHTDVLRNLREYYNSVVEVSAFAKEHSIPTLVIDSAIGFYLSITSEKLPANLVQGIRDWFGYHGFYRIDKPGEVYHFEHKK